LYIGVNNEDTFRKIEGNRYIVYITVTQKLEDMDEDNSILYRDMNGGGRNVNIDI